MNWSVYKLELKSQDYFDNNFWKNETNTWVSGKLTITKMCFLAIKLLDYDKNICMKEVKNQSVPRCCL